MKSINTKMVHNPARNVIVGKQPLSANLRHAWWIIRESFGHTKLSLTFLIIFWTAPASALAIAGGVDTTLSPGPGEVAQAFNSDGVGAHAELGTWFNRQTSTIDMWAKTGATQVSHANLIDNNWELVAPSFDALSLATISGGAVFAGSTNGVFRSTDDGATWANVGLAGCGVGSLAVSPTTQSMFAGTPGACAPAPRFGP